MLAIFVAGYGVGVPCRWPTVTWSRTAVCCWPSRRSWPWARWSSPTAPATPLAGFSRPSASDGHRGAGDRVRRVCQPRPSRRDAWRGPGGLVHLLVVVSDPGAGAGVHPAVVSHRPAAVGPLAPGRAGGGGWDRGDRHAERPAADAGGRGLPGPQPHRACRGPRPEEGTLGAVLFGLLLACSGAATLLVVVRFRRSRGVERHSSSGSPTPPR
jgi:hypothetical protein